MNQNRLGLAIEVAFNIVIGFSINWVCNMLILPYYGFQIHAGAAFSMGLVFTVISVARQYILRRFFNNRMHLFAIKLAQRIES